MNKFTIHMTKLIVLVLLISILEPITALAAEPLRLARFDSTSLSDTNEKFTIECENYVGLENSKCVLKDGSPTSKMPMTFVAQQEQHRYLQKLTVIASAKAVLEAVRRFEQKVSNIDIALLNLVVEGKSKCLVDKGQPDFLLSCLPLEPDTTAFVFFIRGLCDRCDFAPFIMRLKSN